MPLSAPAHPALSLIALLGMAVALPAAVQAEFTVDPINGNDANGGSAAAPVRSLVRAQQLVRSVNGAMTGDILVMLRGGEYAMPAGGLALSDADSGTNGYVVRWQAASGQRPVLTGGQSISGGWVLHDSARNIWRRTGVTADFRQLYVGGTLTTRARHPNRDPEVPGTAGSYFAMAETALPFRVHASDIGSWANSGTVELVVQRHWEMPRLKIRSYSVSGSVATLSLATSYGYDFQNGRTPHYYFENSYQFLDAPGEWFLDEPADTLYYLPRAGENLASTAVTIPTVPVLLSLRGSVVGAMHHVSVEGLTFRYSTYTAANSSGYVSFQAGKTNEKAGPMPGAIELANTDSIVLRRNTVEQTGSWGIVGYDTTTRTLIEGNVIRGLAAGAIQLGNDGKLKSRSATAKASANDIIRNNLIEDFGLHYHDAVGIWAGLPDRLTIEHNEIRRGGYSGISVGWVWANSNRNLTGSNIRYNRITDVCQILSDGAGIYSLGNLGTSTFDSNYVANLQPSRGATDYPIVGVYFDEGSDNKVGVGNVVEAGLQRMAIAGASSAAFNANKSVNTRFINGWYTGRLFFNYAGDFSGMVDCTNYAWPAGALAVIDQAGIEDGYRDIGAVPRSRNLAIGATLSSSSSHDATYTASEAADNFPGSLWHSNLTEANPWLQADLGTAKRLTQIDILARQDADQPSTRANVELRASNDASFATSTVIARQGPNPWPAYGLKSFIITDATAYRYVRVQRVGGSGYLTVAELRISGGVPGQVGGGTGGTTPPPAALPDVIVTDLTWTPANPKPGDKVVFSCVVKNQGTADTPGTTSVGTGFSVNGTHVGWGGAFQIAAGASKAMGMASGDSFSNTTWTATAGTFTVVATTDDINRFAESNETNNSLSKTFTISSGTAPTGTGLLAEYFDNSNLSGNAVLTRTDATVNFDWQATSPGTGVPADWFSTRWSGQVEPQFSQTYTFSTTADDGVRLWVNNQLLVDQWRNQGATEYSGSIALTAGQKASIRLEYYEAAGAAVQKLAWSSASQAKQIIPQSRLYPAASGAGPAYVKVVNQWTGDWLHDAGVRAEYGRRTDDTALWRIIDAAGPSWRWIVNKSTGEMLHIEAQADWVQCDVKPDGRWSSMWNFALTTAPWMNIQNRWQGGSALHIEHRSGYLQHKGVSKGWSSAQWFLEVPASAPLPGGIVCIDPVIVPWRVTADDQPTQRLGSAR